MYPRAPESYIDLELSDRVGWFIKLRWLAGPIVCLGTFVGFWLFRFSLPVWHLVIASFGILAYNTGFWFYYRRRRHRSPAVRNASLRGDGFFRFIHLQISLDWIALAFVVHFSGGVQSPVLLFFVFHILIASLLLSPLGCYLQASFAILLIGGMTDLEYAGVLSHFPLYADQVYLYTDTGYPITYMFFFAAALYIAVFLTTSIAAALRRKEQNLKQAHAHLMRMEKLAAMGQLAAGVAHEINNPLGGILAYTHLVLEDMSAGTSEYRNLSKAIRETERCRDIVRSLLDFSRQRPPTLEWISVETPLRQALSLMQTQGVFRRVEVIEKLGSLPMIEGDAHQLEQAFVNILLNAGQAMADGGQLTVATYLDETTDTLQIRFTDTGPGIPEEHLGRVFDPFFTTKDVGKGTGLGLAVTYGIVEQHGGDINIESRVGRGTTVTITLPIDLEAPCQPN